MTKEQMQKRLDQLRKDDRAFKRGTDEFKERLELEFKLEAHLYDKEREE